MSSQTLSIQGFKPIHPTYKYGPDVKCMVNKPLPHYLEPLIPRSCATFRNKLFFLRWGAVSPLPKPQAGGSPLVGCPRPLIRYIRSYPPYLEAISSIRNKYEDAPCRGKREQHKMGPKGLFAIYIYYASRNVRLLCNVHTLHHNSRCGLNEVRLL
jgi:hypothetical protein